MLIEAMRLDLEQLKNLQAIEPRSDSERQFVAIEIEACKESINNIKELIKNHRKPLMK